MIVINQKYYCVSSNENIENAPSIAENHPSVTATTSTNKSMLSTHCSFENDTNTWNDVFLYKQILQEAY